MDPTRGLLHPCLYEMPVGRLEETDVNSSSREEVLCKSTTLSLLITTLCLVVTLACKAPQVRVFLFPDMSLYLQCAGDKAFPNNLSGLDPSLLPIFPFAPRVLHSNPDEGEDPAPPEPQFPVVRLSLLASHAQYDGLKLVQIGNLDQEQNNGVRKQTMSYYLSQNGEFPSGDVFLKFKDDWKWVDAKTCLKTLGKVKDRRRAENAMNRLTAACAVQL